MFNIKRNKEIEYGPTRKDLNIILENQISEKKKELKIVVKDAIIYRRDRTKSLNASR